MILKSGGGFIVYALDYLSRTTLVYGFKPVRPGVLFLSSVVHREYEGEEMQVALGTSFLFKEDGAVTITETDFKEKQSGRAYDTVDVSRHYLESPEFGDFEELLKIDRWDGM